MIVIYPSVLNGKINAPASKAHAQRLLFMSALSDNVTKVCNVPDCEDIDVTLECLKQLGCRITVEKDVVTIYPFPKNIPVQSVNFNFKGSATTARLAIALCGALGVKASCSGSVSLQKRRMGSLTSRMVLRGVKVSNFSLPCAIEGRLEGGDYIIEGSEGSQTISALLMALPLLRDDSTIKLSTPLVDSSFIDLTIESLEKFDIKIERVPNGYFIKGKQYYHSPITIDTENDWGLASMWVTAASACGRDDTEVVVNGLKGDSPQLYRDTDAIKTLLHYDFSYLNIDAKKCPDLATLFAALAIVKGANIAINGVAQLRFKESDRMKLMAEIASELGQTANVLEDGIEVLGNGHPSYPKGKLIDTKEDPWVFMSMALASATATVPFVIKDEHGADKAYRKFLDDFKSLGGQYEFLK